MGQNLFTAAIPWAGADERVKRALGQMDKSHRYVVRLLEACKALKLKAKCQAWFPDCWAHISIPSLKIAIYAKEHTEFAKTEHERKLWEAHGWRMLVAPGRRLDRLTDEQLVEHLREAVAWNGKVTK